MKKLALFTASLLYAVQAASAQTIGLEDACKSQGMKAYPRITEGLGAGSLYTTKLNYPTPAQQYCAGIFKEMKDAQATAVSGGAIGSTGSGTRASDAGIGLSFLGGILGGTSSAKLDAGVKNGDQWKLTTGPLTPDGQTGQGLIRFSLSPGKCLQEIQRSLTKEKRLKVYLLYMTAQTDSLEYSVTHTNNSSAGLAIEIPKLVSFNPKYTLDKKTDTSFAVKGTVNVCYAWQKRTLTADSVSGPGNFRLTSGWLATKK